MKIRSVILAGLLVGGFIYVTSVMDWNPLRLVKPVSDAGRLWSDPDRAKTAGFSSDELNNIDVYKSANQATVNISTVVYRENWFIGIVPVEGVGSGFLIDADGRVLTNYHVVSGTRPEIKVILSDRSSYPAKILYRDVSGDLALLQIEPKKKLPFLKLGDSDNLQVGQKVLAIGNPFGLDGTLTTGVISSLHRSVPFEDGRGMEDMIQTDAAINQGNSGGPLLDSQGNVIGINAMIVGSANIGIGFAIPISRVKGLLEDYRTENRYGRPDPGFKGNYVSGQLAEAMDLPAEGGILVTSVTPGSGAAKAGLRGARQRAVVGNYVEVPIGGDLIMAIDGRAVDGSAALDRAMRGKRPGDVIELTIYRDGRTLKVKVTLDRAAQTL